MKPFFSAVLFASAALNFASVSAQTEAAPVSSPAPAAPTATDDAKGHQCDDCSDCHGDEGTALRKLEQEWADAVVKHDVEAITRIESDDFIATDPSGTVSHKADDIEEAKAGTLNISNFQLADMKVSVYGESAVVTGKTTFRANAGERPLGGDYRWTDVFVRREGKWQVVASQATAIASQQAEKTEE